MAGQRPLILLRVRVYFQKHMTMKRQKRPSGYQQRQAKKSKDAAVKAIAGSLLKWTHKPEAAESTHSIGGKGTSHEQEVESHSSSDNEQRTDSDNEQTDIEQHDADTAQPAQEELETSTVTTSNLSIFNDVSMWQIPVLDSDRIEIIKRGSEPFQNKHGPFKLAKRPGAKVKGELRQLTTDWFYYQLSSGDRVLRSWMAYSPHDGKLYCFYCRLFAKDDKASGTSSFVTGFEAWWKLNPKVAEHEQSKVHLTFLEKWKTLALGLKLQTTIDAAHISMLEKEKKKFRDILHRVLDVILFLARQNLPFRGQNKTKVTFWSLLNCYLTMMLC